MASTFILADTHTLPSLSESINALDTLLHPSPVLTASDLSCSISSGEIPICLFDNAYIIDDKEPLSSAFLDSSFSDIGFSPHTPCVESFDLSSASSRPPSSSKFLDSGNSKLGGLSRQARLRSKSSPETTRNRTFHVSPESNWQHVPPSGLPVAADSVLVESPVSNALDHSAPLATGKGLPVQQVDHKPPAYSHFVQRLGIRIPDLDVDDLTESLMPLSPTELAQQRRCQRRVPIQRDATNCSSMASFAETSDTLLRASSIDIRGDTPSILRHEGSSLRHSDYAEKQGRHAGSPERERGRASTREQHHHPPIYKSVSPEQRRAAPAVESFPWLTDLSIQLLIDQEGFRTAKPTLGFSCITTLRSTSNEKTTRVLKAQFRPVTRQSFHFHYAPLESPPILRRVMLSNSDTHDYVSRQAHLTLKTNGVYVVQGCEMATGSTDAGVDGRLEWRFEYLVDDRRRDPTCRVAEGDKIVTPISFSCSPELFLPQQGKRLNVMHVLRKGVAPKLTAEKLQPPSLPQPKQGPGDSPKTPSPAKLSGFGFGLPEVSPKRLAWNIHRRVQSHHQGSNAQHSQPRDRGSKLLEVGSPPKEVGEEGNAARARIRRRGSFVRESGAELEEGTSRAREGLPISRPKQRMSLASSAPSPTRWGVSPPKSPLVSLGEDLVVSYLPTMVSNDLFAARSRPRGSSKERGYIR